MPTAREIQKRIRSVKNIAQITRALEAVSASKVRRAQARVLASRAFSEKAWEILLNIQQASVHGEPLHPLLTRREEVRNVMIVLITADRGLAGGYNTNITRAAVRFADRLKVPAQFVTIGSKGRDSLIRQKRNVIAQFSDMPADTAIADIAPAARLAMNAFLSGEVDHVYIAYTDFINTLTQRPIVITWPPLMSGMENVELIAAEFSDNHRRAPVLSGPVLDYEYEPGPEAVLDNIVPRFAELQLYQAVLESQASEHSARMVAMRNASENAVAFTADLTLLYNKARQAAITAEILDIVGGTEALQSMIDKTARRIEAEISL